MSKHRVLPAYKNPPGHFSRAPRETLRVVEKVLSFAPSHPKSLRCILADVKAVIEGRI